MHFICQIQRQLANAGHKDGDLVPNFMNCCCFPMFITSQLIKAITPKSLVSFFLYVLYDEEGQRKEYSLFNTFPVGIRHLVHRALNKKKKLTLNVLINF